MGVPLDPNQSDPAPNLGAALDAGRWPAPRWRDKVRSLWWDRTPLSLATLPERLAAVYGSRPAFFLDQPLAAPFFRGDCLTFADFARWVARSAHGLAQIGIGAGQRVGLVTRNRIELAFAEFAAAKLGAVVVPLNAMLRATELRQLAVDADLRALIVDRAVFEETLGGSTRAVPGVAHWVVAGDGWLPPGVHAFADLVARGPDVFESKPAPDDELAMIFYTAGTTGAPKGALLTHGALLFAVRQQARLAALLPTPPRNLALLVMPLAHTSGHQAMLLNLAMGTPALLHGRFDAARVLAAIERQRVTLLSGVPAMYRMLLDAGAERFDLSSLELVAWGGDAMPPELRARFDAVVRRTRGHGPRWVSGYGLAETAGQLTRSLGGREAGLVGRPLRGVAVRIVDAAGRRARRGTVGELWVRSPGLMQGYWNAAEQTRAVLRDGWFRTGDLARRDRLGRIVLVSRVKEMIKVGGYSVFPAEVERALGEHPDVLQVAVVGVPHPTKGQVPAAAVVPRPERGLTAEALLAWAADRIAPYKAPRHVFFVESIPMSAAWKPKRGEVAEHLRALLHRQA